MAAGFASGVRARSPVPGGNWGQVGALATRESSSRTPHGPFEKHNHQLGPGASV